VNGTGPSTDELAELEVAIATLGWVFVAATPTLEGHLFSAEKPGTIPVRAAAMSADGLLKAVEEREAQLRQTPQQRPPIQTGVSRLRPK
jgi:hypothetical protein